MVKIIEGLVDAIVVVVDEGMVDAVVVTVDKGIFNAVEDANVAPTVAILEGDVLVLVVVFVG